MEQHWNCDGWYEQDGFGRQPMTSLQLTFSGRNVSGSGEDMVGAFEFKGVLQPDGAITMRKHYLGQHTVDYFGKYDGEGTFGGHWHVGGFTGPWLITLRKDGRHSGTAIHDLFPATDEL